MANKQKSPYENYDADWESDPYWKLVMQIVGSTAIGVWVIYGLCSYISPNQKEVYWTVLIAGILSYLILIAMFVQAHITHKQWKAMQEQARIMDDTLTEMRLSRELENAAFIGSSRMTFDDHPLRANITQWFRMYLTNSGKTPAVNVRLASGMALMDEGLGDFTPRELIFTDEKVSRSIVPPGEGGFTFDFQIEPLSEIDVIRINREEIFLYAQAKIEYDDIFGKPHWTTICVMFQPPNRFTPCHQGNECDYQHQNPN